MLSVEFLWLCTLFTTTTQMQDLNARLVKSMPMFIQRAPAAIFACTFMKILHVFTTAATANRTRMELIYTIEFNLTQGYAVCRFSAQLYVPAFGLVLGTGSKWIEDKKILMRYINGAANQLFLK